VTRSIFVTMTAFAALISLGGCATMHPSAYVYCQIEKPITWSKADTDETIAEVKEHNAVFKSMGCKL
jgi:shikimate kinase